MVAALKLKSAVAEIEDVSALVPLPALHVNNHSGLDSKNPTAMAAVTTRAGHVLP